MTDHLFESISEDHDDVNTTNNIPSSGWSFEPEQQQDNYFNSSNPHSLEISSLSTHVSVSHNHHTDISVEQSNTLAPSSTGFCHFPHFLQNALNTSNLNELENIIKSYCVANCSIHSRLMSRVEGRHLVQKHFQSLLQILSNCNFQFPIKTVRHRLIVVEEYCVGTILPLKMKTRFNPYGVVSIISDLNLMMKECYH
jgi:hypothetical protein